MRKLLAAFSIGMILISCKDDELPIRGVYGEPGSTMVFNLKLIDPNIEGKAVTASGNAHGKIDVVGNGGYLIYESDPDFTSDVVAIFVDDAEIGTVRFLAENLDNSCKTFARSFDLTFKKNAPPFFQELSPNSCGNFPRNKMISATDIKAIPGLVFSSGGGMYLTLPEDFVGTGESIYDLGYNSSGSSNHDIIKADLLISGRVRITVEE